MQRREISMHPSAPAAARNGASLLGLLLAIAAPAGAQADASAWPVFAVGADLDGGQFSNTSMRIPERALDGLWADGLAGYAVRPDLVVGLDLEAAWTWQRRAAQQAGGTNERGRVLLGGIGARYRIGERFGAGVAIDPLGYYRFTDPTSSNQPDKLTRPFSWRLFGSYYPAGAPRWSIDAGVRHIDWRTFDVNGVDHAQATTQWSVAAGVTYRFGAGASRAP
jgi:hypothetical protein